VKKKDVYMNLLQRAREARKFSYSPYSKFPVGAALLFEDGETVTGCNVENCSYGLSLCAERNAMAAAAASGNLTPVAIAIVGEEGNPCFPCGACRQFLIEFNREMDVVVESDSDIEIYKLNDLLPKHFTLTDR
jgi:cytidine deaminase